MHLEYHFNLVYEVNR